MLNQPTLEKLKTLRLERMITAWTDQQKSPEIGSLAFEERLGLLVDAEWMHRENKRMKRSLKEAKLRLSEACIEAIDFPAQREPSSGNSRRADGSTSTKPCSSREQREPVRATSRALSRTTRAAAASGRSTGERRGSSTS